MFNDFKINQPVNPAVGNVRVISNFERTSYQQILMLNNTM